jgi:hypothetical protein
MTGVIAVDYADVLAEFRLKNAADTFRNYCQETLEQAQDSGKPFDESLYQEAVALVLSKLDQKQQHDN